MADSPPPPAAPAAPAAVDAADASRAGRGGPRGPRGPGGALAFGLAFALAALVLWAARPDGRDGRFEIDEAEWLTMSVHDALQISASRSPLEGVPPAPWRTPEANPWKVGIHESTFGFMNPMLPKLAFGALCLALGHRECDPAVYVRFAKDLPRERKDRALAAVEPARAPVRLAVLALAALSAACLLVVGRALLGWPGGIACFALFLLRPNVVDHATRIRTDFFPIALALGALALALARWDALAGRRGRGAALRSALVLGLLAGLAVGSKLNGALLALAVGAWILLAWLDGRRAERVGFAAGPVGGWLAAGAVTVALFALFNPHLWAAPVANTRDLFEKWEGDLEHQKGRYGERLGRADGPLESLSLSTRALWGELEPLRARTGIPLGAPLLLGGLAWLAWAARRREDARAVLAFAVVVGGGTALWIPFGRDNFFLGLAAPAALLEGLALAAAIDLLRRGRPSRQVIP